ncbi:unnamed protein product, partial [Coregonus sp. 'balchen']
CSGYLQRSPAGEDLDQRWLSDVRDDIVNFVSVVNSGLEMQSNFFTHNNMKVHKRDTMSQILQFVVDDYFPKMHQSAMQKNSDAVVEQASDAADGTFRLKSRAESAAGQLGQSYTVSFSSESTLPSCECEVWRVQRLSCEHFCHVFRSEPNWTWERL